MGIGITSFAGFQNSKNSSRITKGERHVADAKQQHLFEMGALFAEPQPSAEQSPASSDVPAIA